MTDESMIIQGAGGHLDNELKELATSRLLEQLGDALFRQRDVGGLVAHAPRPGDHIVLQK